MNLPHLLTLVHSAGAVACLVMAIGSAASVPFRESLAISGGSAWMVAHLGAWTPLFLLGVCAFLCVLAYGSSRLTPWAWHLTLLAYGIGVAGSLWQVSIGIPQGWLSAAINAAVVAYALRPAVRRAYRGR